VSLFWKAIEKKGISAPAQTGGYPFFSDPTRLYAHTPLPAFESIFSNSLAHTVLSIRYYFNGFSLLSFPANLGMVRVFSFGVLPFPEEKLKQEHAAEKEELINQIGQLTIAVNWLKKNFFCANDQLENRSK
jgi:hypothetical protein